MLTIPYMLITATEETKQQAVELLGKTEIIALAPLEAESMVAPYTAVGNEDIPQAQGVINLLQKQLQAEADAGWPLVFIPRMFKPTTDLMEIEGATSTSKHAFPTITIPQTVQPGLNPPFPEVYFSLYADQDIEVRVYSHEQQHPRLQFPRLYPQHQTLPLLSCAMLQLTPSTLCRSIATSQQSS
jgi:nuclear cap-binding protein subunit 1